jgi:hypothetical protein
MIAVGRDVNPRHILHDEVWRAIGRGIGIEHPCDAWMFHQGQSLTLGLKARDYFTRVHPGFDQLERHATVYRFFLLSRQTSPIPPSPIFCSR